MEIELYDADGDPVAYILEENDNAIYLWSGDVVAYVMDEKVYGWNGKHLGWLLDGVVCDRSGRRLGGTEEVTEHPNSPGTRKGKGRPQPYHKRQREGARARPRVSNLYSMKPLEIFLAEGR